MSAERLNRRITLQRKTVTRNAHNEPVASFTDIGTFSAQRRDVSAAESARAQEIGSELTVRFLVRHSSLLADLNTNDRLVYLAKVHNITGVRETVFNQWLEIDAVTRNDLVAAET